MKNEVRALVLHQCFDFKSPNYKPSKDYQYVRLHLVYNIKADLTYKARLVCDGSRVDPKDLSTRATVVNGVSVCLLNLIADSKKLSIIYSDIGNAFIQPHTKGKIYTKCSPGFGESVGSIAISVLF